MKAGERKEGRKKKVREGGREGGREEKLVRIMK